MVLLRPRVFCPLCNGFPQPVAMGVLYVSRCFVRIFPVRSRTCTRKSVFEYKARPPVRAVYILMHCLVASRFIYYLHFNLSRYIRLPHPLRQSVPQASCIFTHIPLLRLLPNFGWQFDQLWELARRIIRGQRSDLGSLIQAL